jgi:hypothetical protein
MRNVGRGRRRSAATTATAANAIPPTTAKQMSAEAWEPASAAAW